MEPAYILSPVENTNCSLLGIVPPSPKPFPSRKASRRRLRRESLSPAICPPMNVARFLCSAISAVCLAAGLLAPASTQAAIDLNGDTIPDIWALVYDAGGLNPSGD